jgi:putative transposase
MTQQPFNWFDPHRAVRVYKGNLPHWRQDGGLYFVTFRLADSIPKHVLARWDGERRSWLEAHGISGYPDSSNWQKELDRLSEDKRRMFSRMNAKRLFVELDQCHGECWLRNGAVREVLAESMRHFDGSRWRVGDFVIMPNHVHLLVVMAEGSELEEVLYSVKRFSARKINEVLKRNGRVWQKEYYDHIVRDRAELFRVRKYIVDNSNRAGLNESEFLYDRASWLDESVAPDSDPVCSQEKNSALE